MFSVKSFCYQNFAHPLQPLVKMLVLEVCRGVNVETGEKKMPLFAKYSFTDYCRICSLRSRCLGNYLMPTKC